MMSFGTSLRAADTAEPAHWLRTACRGAFGTVGALVPNQLESVIRVNAPAACADANDWWSSYQGLFGLIASIGERHTACADQCWFAVWEGHGFDTGSTHIAHRGPLDEQEKRELERQREVARDDDRSRNAAVRASLDTIPRFSLPERTYYLVQGTAASVRDMSYPGEDGWRNPDLFWPDDRRWFVATDVDFWSLYVGGAKAFVDEIERSVPTGSERVDLNSPLVVEV